jgi:WD40 repeat protein
LPPDKAANKDQAPLAQRQLPWIWKEQRTLSGHRSGIWCAAFSPDDKLLITGSTRHQGPPGEIKIWDVASGRELKTVECGGSVRWVSFTRDGKSFATAVGSEQGAAYLRDTATAEVIRTYVGHERTIDTLAFSADDAWLATTGFDRSVIIWNVKTGELLRKLEGHQSEIYPVAFSAKGRRVLTGDSAGLAILWDAATGKLLHTLRGHKKAVQVTAFAEDDKTLVTGSWDDTLKLWDAETGAELATLKGHAAAVMGLAFSPDRRMMASSSGRWGYEYSRDDEVVKKSTGEVILWDFERRKPLVTLRAHSDSIIGLAFASDGKTLATTSFDRQIKLWRGFQANKSAAPLTVQELSTLWEKLASEDPVRKNAAVETLAGMPEQSLPFLLERLRTVKPSQAEKSAAALIGQLSDAKLSARESATAELRKLGGAIAPQLRLALDKGPTVEARRRLNRLLDGLPSALTADQQRLQYATIAIELMATPDAYLALSDLVQGDASGIIAEEAYAGLKRRPTAGK